MSPKRKYGRAGPGRGKGSSARCAVSRVAGKPAPPRRCRAEAEPVSGNCDRDAGLRFRRSRWLRCCCDQGSGVLPCTHQVRRSSANEDADVRGDRSYDAPRSTDAVRNTRRPGGGSQRMWLSRCVLFEVCLVVLVYGCTEARVVSVVEIALTGPAEARSAAATASAARAARARLSVILGMVVAPSVWEVAPHQDSFDAVAGWKHRCWQVGRPGARSSGCGPVEPGRHQLAATFRSRNSSSVSSGAGGGAGKGTAVGIE